MGSFSNGEMWRQFEYTFCRRCAHYRLDEGTDTYGCPVSDAHLMQVSHSEDVQFVLDLLIEPSTLGNECKMFLGATP